MRVQMTKVFLSVLFCICLCSGGLTSARADEIKLENDYATWLIDSKGYNVSLVDKQHGKERLAQSKRCVCVLRKDNKSHVPTTCTYSDGKLTLKYEKAAVTVVLKITCKKHYFVFEVESVEGAGDIQLSLCHLAVAKCTRHSGTSCTAFADDFAFACLGADLKMHPHVGGRPVLLVGTCVKERGLVGAKLVIAACPTDQLRTVLKEIVKSEGMPYSRLGGPFSLDAEENRGSYVFASDISTKNVDDWIAMAKKAGLTTIHFSTGWSNSLGHYVPNKKKFPKGIDSLKAGVSLMLAQRENVQTRLGPEQT